jgi:hypothetical protein
LRRGREVRVGECVKTEQTTTGMCSARMLLPIITRSEAPYGTASIGLEIGNENTSGRFPASGTTSGYVYHFFPGQAPCSTSCLPLLLGERANFGRVLLFQPKIKNERLVTRKNRNQTSSSFSSSVVSDDFDFCTC